MAEETKLSLDTSNSNSTWGIGFYNAGAGIPMMYNGIEVRYFPKSFVEKGTTTGTLGGYTYPSSGYGFSQGNVAWFGNTTFLNQDTWNFLKPATLDKSIVDQIAPSTPDVSNFTWKWDATGQTYQYAFDMRSVENFTDGYIIEKDKYFEYASKDPKNYGLAQAYSPPRIPSGMGTAPDGNMSYIGYTSGGGGYDRRSDVFYVNNTPAAQYGYHQISWQDCGSFGCGFSDFLSGPIGSLFILGARIINPWFNLGYTATNLALGKGSIGDVALAVINVNTPTPTGPAPAAGTVFEIPQIASATSKIATSLQEAGVLTDAKTAADAAKVIMNTGLTYLANGQDFEKAFASAAGTYLGQQAGSQLAKSLSVQSADIQKIMTATTTATTKAMLLNQNVEKAAMSAFVSTSIPLALDGALKETGLTLSKSVRDAMSSAATTAALMPNADVNEVIRSAVTGAVVSGAVDKVKTQLISDGVIDASNVNAINKVTNYLGLVLSGRSVDSIITQSVLNEAMAGADKAAKNFVAEDKGWKDWDTWTNAKSLLGNDVTPQAYEERVVSPEKIIKILDQEGVPATERQNIIDFYQGVVGKNSTAEQVLADVRRFVNPLYMTDAENQYLNNVFSKIDGFAQESFQPEYEKAIKAAKAGDFSAVEQIANFVDKSYTSTNEAINLLKQAARDVGEIDYEPSEQEILQLKGNNQVSAYTIAQEMAAIKATTFDGTKYATPQEANAAARQNGFSTFEASDGNTYKVIPVIAEAEIRASIESKPTFSEAFAAARAELGSGRTFLWNGKQYTTNVLPDGVFDGSRSSSIETAAVLAHSRGQDRFIGPDGKIYSIPENARSILENAVNQSPAETARLLRQAVTPMPDETKAETQRLMDSGTRGTMDTISAMTSQVLGTTQRGIANFLTNAGKTYASLTGDLSFENAMTRLGDEIEQYAKGNDVYGLDIQKERLNRAIALSKEVGEDRVVERTDEFGNVVTTIEPGEKSFGEKWAIISGAIKNNPLGFFDISGSEIVEEVPETIAQIAAAFLTGGTSLAATGAVAAISAAGTVVESFGNSAETAYKAAKAQGLSDEKAAEKAYLNGMVSTMLEMGPEIVADKFLVGSLFSNVGNSLAKLGTGVVSNAAIGAATGFVSGASQSYAEQLIINPGTASFSKAISDGIFESTIGGAVQTGLYGASAFLNPGSIIGKDYGGNDVTLSDVLTGGKVIDSSTINPNASVLTTDNKNSITLGGMFTMMPDIGLSSDFQQTYLPQIYSNPDMVVGQNALGDNITYSQLLSQVTEDRTYSDVFNSVINPTDQQKVDTQKQFISDQFKTIGFDATPKQIDEAVVENPNGNQSIIDNAKRVAFTETAKQENYTLTDKVLESFLAPGSAIQTVDQLKGYIDPLSVTADEARQFLFEQGYTKPTEDEISSIMSTVESDARQRAITMADPYVIDANEIKAVAQSEGFAISDEDAQKLAREANEEIGLAEYRTQIDPMAVTEIEAREFFNEFGYTPTTEELAQFIASKSEADIRADIQAYVDPRQVTRGEAEKFFSDLGYTPTEEEIQQFIQSGPTLDQAAIQTQVGQYVDPRMVDEQEVRDAYAKLGLDKPLQVDIQNLIGQYAEEDLAGRAEANLTAAKINSIYDQLDDISKTASEETARAINTVKLDLANQLAALGADVGKPAVQDDPATTDVDESAPATGLYATINQQLQDTQKSIAGVETSILNKMREYESTGIARDEALNRAINDVSTELGVAKTDLSTQIGTPAVVDDPTTPENEAKPATGIYGVIAGFEAETREAQRAIQDEIAADRLAREAAEAEKARAGQRSNLLQQGMQLLAPAIGAATLTDDTGAKFKKPFISSTMKQEEFKGPLEEFQERIQEGSYLEPTFTSESDEGMREFMGMEENTEQGESFMPNYFTYGEQQNIDQMFDPFGPTATSFNPFQPFTAAQGGLVPPLMAMGGLTQYAGGGLPIVAHSGKNRIDFRQGAAVSGPGDGQSDDIPAMLADGEFVIPADVVAALGNGSTKAGSDKLYDMMHSIRSYHRSAHPKDLPPPSKKNPLDYLKKPSKGRR